MTGKTEGFAVVLRAAEVADAEGLLGLCRQLGRDVPLDDVRAYLLSGQGDAGHRLLVAEVDGGLGGWLEVALRRALGTKPWAEVSGLVVDARLRGKGVGRALLEAARRWAQTQGLGRLRVRTRLEREGAARFYENAGLKKEKQQWVFEGDV